MARISKLVGDMFEAGIEGKLELLKQTGVLAWAEKQQPEWFYNRKLRVWMRGTPSGADFHGTLVEQLGGLSFALEAKSTGPEDGDDGVLILEKRITPTQRAHLDAVWAANRCAFLAAQFRRPAAPWLTAVIPWGLVPWEKAITRHRLHAEHVEQWRVPMNLHLFEHLLPRRRQPESALERLAADVDAD